MDRLVLGSGAVGTSLLERLDARDGSLVVLLGDDQQAASLREEGIDARTVDPTDPTAVRAVAGPVGSVVAFPAAPGRAPALTETARSAYPEAFVLACLGAEAVDTDRRLAAEYADRVVDLVGETSSRLVERAGDPGTRTRRLQRTLRDVDGTLGIFTHDNPDPDAIASAVCLQHIAEAAGTAAEVCYYGDIDHQENRALVNLLEYDLRNIDPDADLDSFAGFALVDHSRPGVNSGLPEETPVDVVIDHHPPRAPVEATFVDLRSEVGATCTLLTDHLRTLDVEPGTDLATGLLYGLRTDTKEFSREVSTADLEAAAMLVEYADTVALQRIESPNVTGETLDTVGDAVRNRSIEGDVLTTCVGEVSDRDALAQAADRLLGMDGVSTTLVFGYTDEVAFVSARSRDADVDLGETLREAFGAVGSAGGHGDMAGAQLSVEMLLEESDDEDRRLAIEDVLVERFFETLDDERERSPPFGYGRFFEIDDGR